MDDLVAAHFRSRAAIPALPMQCAATKAGTCDGIVATVLETAHSILWLKSSARAEWVSAPREMASTSASA